MKEYLTTYEIAKLCNMHPTTVRNQINKGIFKAEISPGGGVRKGRLKVKREEVLKFMKKKGIPVPPVLLKNEYRILIIEDEAGVAKTIEMVIDYLAEKIGEKIEVEIAKDGLEAGLKICQFRPHLITLDCQLPGLDGDVVLENIRRNDAYKDIKVIAITGHKHYIPRLKELKAEAILDKPFDKNELESLICKFLNIKSLPNK